MTSSSTSNSPAAKKNNMPRNTLLLNFSFLLSASSSQADAFAFFPPRSLFHPTALSNDAIPPRSHSRTSTQSNLFHILNGGNKDDDSGNSKQSQNKKKSYSPLEDEPWKNDESYWDMLQKASKDPATFEKFIEESVAKKKKLGSASVVASSLASSDSSTALEAGESSPPPKTKKGTYQRIEEWDAQRQNGNGNMSEEERLQWECQKMGNQFRQNEILRHHLNSF
ncbi:hypothetical protein ACHAXS_005209 [Conticribra weissflogii]